MSAVVVAQRLSSLVRLEHTVFALPYAYVGAVLAADGWPGIGPMVWITVAMAGARTLAMALNRLIDAEIDARNPRTATRDIPAGRLTKAQVATLCAIALVVFGIALSQLPRITWYLSPIVIAGFVIYPYLKRFTPLCHLWLGVVDGLAPVGAWIAVTGRVDPEPFLLLGVVAAWMTGFDVIYATVDVEVDRAQGLHSIPADIGIARGLRLCRALHVLCVALMVAVGLALGLGVAYYVGVAACGALLAYENAIVRPDDLSRVNAAFFNVNAVIAGLYLAAVVADVAIR